jgi:hypothetical protein
MRPREDSSQTEVQLAGPVEPLAGRVPSVDRKDSRSLPRSVQPCIPSEQELAVRRRQTDSITRFQSGDLCLCAANEVRAISHPTANQKLHEVFHRHSWILIRPIAGATLLNPVILTSAQEVGGTVRRPAAFPLWTGSHLFPPTASRHPQSYGPSSGFRRTQGDRMTTCGGASSNPYNSTDCRRLTA